MNEAEYNWQLVRLLHPHLKNCPLIDSLQPEDFKNIVPFEHANPFLAFMPGVSVSAEAWSLHKWEDLCRLARMRFPHLDVLFLLGPAEVDIEETLRTRLADCRGVQFQKFDNLSNVLGALQVAWGYVGPSTGITHLASAMRCPGVGLYPAAKSMHPKRWAPFLSSLEILSPAAQTDPRDVIESLAKQLQPKALVAPIEKPFISGFVICKNEELNIRRCLDSIRWCDEILIVDSGSQDRTLDIVREYPNTRIIERGWPGHREQKQFALEHCKGEWILNLDADEELSLELRAEIQRLLETAKEDSKKVADGYFLCRVVYFLNRWWDRGGWFPEFRMRFFRREKAYWGGVNPHEKAMVQGTRRKLRGHIYHYTSRGIGDYVDTLNRFSENSAQALFQAGVRSNPIRILLHPVFRFFKFYFLKRGFLEGTLGFIMASTEAFYTFLKYAKLWELSYKQKNSLNREDMMAKLVAISSEHDGTSVKQSFAQDVEDVKSATQAHSSR
jgi:glycosyltransferase involved in cell wall biosynthesis